MSRLTWTHSQMSVIPRPATSGVQINTRWRRWWRFDYWCSSQGNEIILMEQVPCMSVFCVVDLCKTTQTQDVNWSPQIVKHVTRIARHGSYPPYFSLSLQRSHCIWNSEFLTQGASSTFSRVGGVSGRCCCPLHSRPWSGNTCAPRFQAAAPWLVRAPRSSAPPPTSLRSSAVNRAHKTSPRDIK